LLENKSWKLVLMELRGSEAKQELIKNC